MFDNKLLQVLILHGTKVGWTKVLYINNNFTSPSFNIFGEVFHIRTTDAIIRFVHSKQAKGLSPHTIRWYQGILNLYARKFHIVPSKPEDIEGFLAECKAGDERKHGYYRTLRCFYGFLHRRANALNPMQYIEAPKRKPKIPHTLTPEAINKLLNYSHQPKIKAALLFLIDSGARVGELASIQVADLIETQWGFIAKIKGKTGPRLIPINYETYHALMINLPLNYSTNRLARLISLAFKQAGIKGTAHTLRHTFGTLWAGDELTLQQIMGHSHLSTTRLYRHLRTETLCQQHHQYSPLKMVLSSSKSMI